MKLKILGYIRIYIYIYIFIDLFQYILTCNVMVVYICNFFIIYLCKMNEIKLMYIMNATKNSGNLIFVFTLINKHKSKLCQIFSQTKKVVSNFNQKKKFELVKIVQIDRFLEVMGEREITVPESFLTPIYSSTKS